MTIRKRSRYIASEPSWIKKRSPAENTIVAARRVYPVVDLLRWLDEESYKVREGDFKIRVPVLIKFVHPHGLSVSEVRIGFDESENRNEKLVLDIDDSHMPIGLIAALRDLDLNREMVTRVWLEGFWPQRANVAPRGATPFEVTNVLPLTDEDIRQPDESRVFIIKRSKA
jgi:hypothetical protein